MVVKDAATGVISGDDSYPSSRRTSVLIAPIVLEAGHKSSTTSITFSCNRWIRTSIWLTDTRMAYFQRHGNGCSTKLGSPDLLEHRINMNSFASFIVMWQE